MFIKNVKDAFQGKSAFGKKRSPRWNSVRKNFLAKNPICAVCEGTEKIEVHHIVPFHLNPDLELEESNLITLCESKSYGIICHLLVGHLGNYKNVNPSAKEDALFWNERLTKARNLNK